MQKLLDFLNRLDAVALSYRIEHNRDESVMVIVAVPSQRWEVEFFANDDIEVEVFEGIGGVEGPERLEELFDRHSE